MNGKGWDVYRNDLGFCLYPWEDDCFGHCWSYANYVDKCLTVKNEKIDTEEKLKKYCKNCEFYKGK